MTDARYVRDHLAKVLTVTRNQPVGARQRDDNECQFGRHDRGEPGATGRRTRYPAHAGAPDFGESRLYGIVIPQRHGQSKKLPDSSPPSEEMSHQRNNDYAATHGYLGSRNLIFKSVYPTKFLRGNLRHILTYREFRRKYIGNTCVKQLGWTVQGAGEACLGRFRRSEFILFIKINNI
jgi:hypothetical protein